MNSSTSSIGSLALPQMVKVEPEVPSTRLVSVSKELPTKVTLTGNVTGWSTWLDSRVESISSTSSDVVCNFVIWQRSSPFSKVQTLSVFPIHWIVRDPGCPSCAQSAGREVLLGQGKELGGVDGVALRAAGTGQDVGVEPEGKVDLLIRLGGTLI